MLSWRPEGLRLVKAPLYRPEIFLLTGKTQTCDMAYKSCRCRYWCESPWSVYLHREEPRVEMNRVVVCRCWSWLFLFVCLQTWLHCCIPDKNLRVIWQWYEWYELYEWDLSLWSGPTSRFVEEQLHSVQFPRCGKGYDSKSASWRFNMAIWQFWPRDLTGHRRPLRPGAAMAPCWG